MDRRVTLTRPWALAPIAAGIVATLAVLAAPLGDQHDLHRRLQQARLAAELSCGRPTLFASRPPDPDSLERFDWASLLEIAASGAPHERWQAIEILGEFGDGRAVPSLLQALVDRRGTVRPCLAAQSLGRLGDSRAVDALIDAAQQRANEDLQLCAIKSLGLLRSERAIPVLVAAVRRGDMLVPAAYALARIGTHAGARVVAEATRDPKQAPWLVEPLGEFGLAGVEPELQRLAESASSSTGTRLAAREALWKLEILLARDREISLVRVLEAEDASQRRAWAAWRLGDEGLVGSLDALAAALEDPSDRVAMAAAAALLRFGSVSEEILLARASNPGAGRRLAVAALGLVGTERSLGFLASIGDPDEIGRVATRSLQWLRLRGFSNRNALASRRLGSSRP